MRSWLASTLLGFVLLAGAGCGEPCKDADGDGRGANCKAGPDCDDTDPKLGADCSALGKQCAKDEFAEGCPCYVGEHQSCYAGAAATLDVGMCHAGEQMCRQIGIWTGCENVVLPQYESCNGKDDDCDGRTDEGALSPCGGCDDTCIGGVWGPPAAPFETTGELALTLAGELTLSLEPVDARTVWVPNTGEGTLSKVDAESATELARYRVAGDSPERVAIDYNGDAWVLSPALEGQSMLTKVAGLADACDGARQTSRAGGELLPLGDDGCVLLTAPVGAAGAVARALAVDGTSSSDGKLGGNLWVGLQADARVLELDGESATSLREIATPGLTPFAATFDPWGVLWLIDREGHLGRIDPALEPPSVDVQDAPLRCYTLDSLASDAQGTLTITGDGCEDVLVYHPSSGRWQQLATPSLLDARGITLLGADRWVTHTAGSLSRIGGDPLAFERTFSLADGGFVPLEAIAIGADSLGQLWVVSSMGAPAGNGVLTRFDPDAAKVTAEVPLGLLPRAQGDVTGDRRLGVFAAEASAEHVFTGCGVARLDPSLPTLPQPTDWLRLHVAASLGSGGSVRVEARKAASSDALEQASYVTLGTLPDDTPPYAVPFDTGGVVEVRLSLYAGGRKGAPRIARVGLEWRCPGPE